MCGIVGLYLKNREWESQLGTLFAPMLLSMSERGPDSAGFAVYGDSVADGWEKFTLVHAQASYNWRELINRLGDEFQCRVELKQNANVAIVKIEAEVQKVREALARLDPAVQIFSVGKSIEIVKATGLPETIAETYKLANMVGSHMIGHTRMATESAVTTAGSHPFTTGEDLCLVHNGSLSNHNRLRRKLQHEGMVFETENDSEVAAGFLTWRLLMGDDLNAALERALTALDGFYTFAVGTRNGFAVLRDPIACKPAILAETDAYVAMGSEYRALSGLPGIEQAHLWEPEPAKVYFWGEAA